MIGPVSATPLSYDDLLLALATWVLRGAVVWSCLIGIAALVEAGTRGRVRATSWVATPPAVRRALLAGLGVLLAGTAPGPVSATAMIGSPHRPEPPATAEAAVLPVPGRPAGRPRRSAVLVRSGDTLWGLAAARLPRGADDARVLVAVRRWHARNRRVIGPDPDLLLPGERLAPPPSVHRLSPAPLEESR